MQPKQGNFDVFRNSGLLQQPRLTPDGNDGPGGGLIWIEIRAKRSARVPANRRTKKRTKRGRENSPVGDSSLVDHRRCRLSGKAPMASSFHLQAKVPIFFAQSLYFSLYSSTLFFFVLIVAEALRAFLSSSLVFYGQRQPVYSLIAINSLVPAYSTSLTYVAILGGCRGDVMLLCILLPWQ